ncbi:CBS domain-containing protein [Aureibaculum marinum]|uniref:CBS domain-containing protein n=1 Tax=Aureibaculum marinum TaxID=2487930 RepID=A0A3N4NRX1_9FLAO|nr:CBS domain-containing protein [Aureibaculum marinum]RPD99081.1 CBS domain-containing protein [Aureibaculum marinum]
MNTSNYISKDIKPLLLTDKISNAKKLFNSLTCTHLPIIKEGNFIGLIAENDIQTIIEDNQSISEYYYLIQSFFALENANWFELLKIFAINETTIIPVVTNKQKYLGYYELADILNIFNNTPFLNQSGAVVVISKDVNDYSFSEISQIVESNNAKVLGAFISKIDKEFVEVTLKISDHDLNNTIQSFRRYNYSILNNFHFDEYLNTLKERSDYLQKYLNM